MGLFTLEFMRIESPKQIENFYQRLVFCVNECLQIVEGEHYNVYLRKYILTPKRWEILINLFSFTVEQNEGIWNYR